MTLSKNEQIAFFIVIVAVTLGIGLFVFLLPEYNKISDNKKLRESKVAELAALEAEVHPSIEKELDEKIVIAYEDGSTVANVFYEEMTPYDADRLIRHLLSTIPDPHNTNIILEVELDNLEISGIKTEPMAINLFRPNEVTYNIKEQADVDSSILMEGRELADPTEEELAEMELQALIRLMSSADRNSGMEYYLEHMQEFTPMNLIAMREFLVGQSETVVAQTVSFTIPMTADHFDAFSTYIFNLEQAVLIKSFDGTTVSVDSGDNMPTTPSVSLEGGRVTMDIPSMWLPLMNYDIELAFLCAQRMEEPAWLDSVEATESEEE